MDRRLSRGQSSVLKNEVRVFCSVCESINTPRSLACYMLAKADQWADYLSLPPADPEKDTFADDYLVSEMMRKNPRINAGVDTRAAAVEKFRQAEAMCAETNQRLREWFEGRNTSVPCDVNTVIEHARRRIAAILGPLTRSKLRFAQAHMRFGPGATSAVSGSDVLLSRKLTCSMHVTPRLYPYTRCLLGPVWGQHVEDISITPHSKVTTVPKSALTDRCIAIEPHLNIYVQLGIGALLRRQLALSGLDLNTQSRNQKLASRAQADGLATIDLSSASDTIARELVWLLLPVDWAALLDLPRTEYSLLDGEEIRLEKWSSMGNGYTFELESLIFWALAQACGDPYSVSYGDDIIISQAHAELLIRTLEFCGFKVNSKKTFLAGRFFESCGSDWWNGQNIRPFYLKGEAANVDSYFIRVTNAIARYASRRGYAGLFKDSRFLPAWLRSYECLSRLAKTTAISDGFGDDGVIRDLDDVSPHFDRARRCFAGRVLSARPVKSRRTCHTGAYLAALSWGTPSEISRSCEFVRGSMRYAARTSLQYIPDWRDLGPWA